MNIKVNNNEIYTQTKTYLNYLKTILEHISKYNRKGYIDNYFLTSSEALKISCIKERQLYRLMQIAEKDKVLIKSKNGFHNFLIPANSKCSQYIINKDVFVLKYVLLSILDKFDSYFIKKKKRKGVIIDYQTMVSHLYNSIFIKKELLIHYCNNINEMRTYNTIFLLFHNTLYNYFNNESIITTLSYKDNLINIAKYYIYDCDNDSYNEYINNVGGLIDNDTINNLSISVDISLLNSNCHFLDKSLKYINASVLSNEYSNYDDEMEIREYIDDDEIIYKINPCYFKEKSKYDIPNEILQQFNKTNFIYGTPFKIEAIDSFDVSSNLELIAKNYALYIFKEHPIYKLTYKYKLELEKYGYYFPLRIKIKFKKSKDETFKISCSWRGFYGFCNTFSDTRQLLLSLYWKACYSYDIHSCSSTIARRLNRLKIDLDFSLKQHILKQGILKIKNVKYVPIDKDDLDGIIHYFNYGGFEEGYRIYVKKYFKQIDEDKKCAEANQLNFTKNNYSFLPKEEAEKIYKILEEYTHDATPYVHCIYYYETLFDFLLLLEMKKRNCKCEIVYDEFLFDSSEISLEEFKKQMHKTFSSIAKIYNNLRKEFPKHKKPNMIPFYSSEFISNSLRYASELISKKPNNIDLSSINAKDNKILELLFPSDDITSRAKKYHDILNYLYSKKVFKKAFFGGNKATTVEVNLCNLLTEINEQKYEQNFLRKYFYKPILLISQKHLKKVEYIIEENNVYRQMEKFDYILKYGDDYLYYYDPNNPEETIDDEKSTRHEKPKTSNDEYNLKLKESYYSFLSNLDGIYRDPDEDSSHYY